MKESPDNPAEDTDPGAEVLPVLHAAHELLCKGLDATGHKDGIFAVVCLLPIHSDKAGHDVIRVACNLPPEEISGFLQHIARSTDDKAPGQVMSMAQALRLIAMLKDPDAIVAELKKRGVH